jgi:hypothetical protein
MADSVKKIKIMLIVLIVSSLLGLTGCEMLPDSWELPWQQDSTATPEQTEVPLPTGVTEEATEVVDEQTPTPAPPPEKLILWLPPGLDPNGETESAAILKARLDEFAYLNSIEIDVRIKAVSGGGGLLDALRTTHAAAPASSPDVVALSREHLLRAVQDEVVFASEGLNTMMSDLDWYNFGRDAGLVQGEVRAVPFKGVPMGLVYQSVSQLIPSNEWADTKLNYGYFGFAGDDPRGTFLLLLYLSLGGQVQNEQGLTVLQEAPLTAALQILKDGLNTRHFSDLVVTMQNSEQVWEEFSMRRVDTAFLPVDVVMRGMETSPEAPDPAFTSPSMTLTDAWVWALGSEEPQRQELALALIAHLSETQFLAEWSEALKALPARPTALGAWEEISFKPALEKMASGAVLYPPDAVMNDLGPILRNATLLILQDNADVVETARQAVESVK